ncbi:LysM peptidoglycan-binding domain-containing protein [Oligoflexaceae bacterium]|nr:LysM peptidoglycan-binding domain-containing protein [Oligoflexaceae bacterium]
MALLGVILGLFSACRTGSSQKRFRPIVPKLNQAEVNTYLKQIDKDIAVEAKQQDYVEENTLASDPAPSNDPKPTLKQDLKADLENTTGIPIEVNEKVQEWIRYFSEKDHDRFQRFLNRGEKYRKVVEDTLVSNGLPKELYYLAMIESGFSKRARSHASAVGIWQFIKPTAQRYGLRVDYYADERIDPMRATNAAAHYLKDLHTVFQSWYLAMSAYNSGEMRVLGAIMRHNSRDFWKLVDLKALPRETMNYVPKVLAAAIIGNHPERFGFEVEKVSAMEEASLVKVPGRVRLADVSKQIGLSYKALKELNPHLSRGIVPDAKGSYEVWVPAEYVSAANSGYALLAKKKVRRPLMVAEQPAKYRVKRGDNLSKIAQRFGLSVSKLKKMNKMRSSKIYVGRSLKVGSQASTVSYKKYRVRRGDTLASIARKYGTSIRTLKKKNKMRSSRLYAGGTIRVPAGAARAKSISHRVKRGENLSRISRKYGVSVSQLKKLNKLRRSHIYAGQVLKIQSRM